MKNKTKRKIKAAGTVLFLIYILALIYFLFFAERFSGVEFAQREYHYNLTPLQEIRRFWIYKEQLGVLAVVSNLFGNLLNEAALHAARKNKKEISMQDIKDSFIRVALGTEKKSHIKTELERKITAYHEAGMF